MNPTTLTDWRKKHGYTKTALARALGVTYHTVREWEQGLHRPPSCLPLALAHLHQLAKDRTRKRRERAKAKERRTVARVEPEPAKFY